MDLPFKAMRLFFARPMLPVRLLPLCFCLILAADDAAGRKMDEEKPEVKPWRLGVLFWHDSPNDEAALDGIRTALEAAGKSHELIIRRADSSPKKVSSFLAEFRNLPVDLIFAMGTRAALYAAEATREIPIVFTAVTNPVESKVVPSWKGSGRNVAGNSNWISSETLLHVFRLAVPDLGKLGLLRSTQEGEVSAAELSAMKEYLARKGAPKIEIIEKVVKKPEEIGAAARSLAGSGVQAIWIPIDFLIYSNMDAITAAVEPLGIPLVSSSLKATRAGAVAGVVVDYTMLGKRAVVLALHILERRKKPGDMPVGTMNAYKVIVNLNAARRCRYELPLSLLALADTIIGNTALPEKHDVKEKENGK